MVEKYRIDPFITVRALWLETSSAADSPEKWAALIQALPSDYHATSAPAMRAAISGSRRGPREKREKTTNPALDE
jgi:hypothetical protein